MSGLRWSQEQLNSALKTGGVKISGDRRETRKDQDKKLPPAEKKRSELEVRLEQQIFVAGLPKPETEWYCVPGRGWKLDFAWPLMTPPRYVEVQGMSHRIKSKFLADIEKRATLTLNGWRGIEVAGDTIRSGEAIAWVKRLLEE